MVNNIDMTMGQKRFKEDNVNHQFSPQITPQMTQSMQNASINLQKTGFYSDTQENPNFNQMNNIKKEVGDITNNNPYDMKHIDNLIQKTSDQKAQQFIDVLLKKPNENQSDEIQGIDKQVAVPPNMDLGNQKMLQQQTNMMNGINTGINNNQMVSNIAPNMQQQNPENNDQQMMNMSLMMNNMNQQQQLQPNTISKQPIQPT